MTAIPTQADFFSADDARRDDLREQSERARGVYTLERLRLREPKRFAMIFSAVNEGRLSTREICDLYDCSDKTVTAIRKKIDVTTEPVTTLKENIGRRFIGIVHASQERIAEAYADPTERKKITPKDAAIIAGISAQNALVMLGEANQIIEHRDAPTLADLDNLANAIDAEAMDLGAGAEIQKSGAAMGETMPAIEAAAGQTMPAELTSGGLV